MSISDLTLEQPHCDGSSGHTDRTKLSAATEFHEVPRNVGLKAAALAIKSGLEPSSPEVHPPSIHHHDHAWELGRNILDHRGQSLPELATTTGGVCLMKPPRRQAKSIDERGLDA